MQIIKYYDTVFEAEVARGRLESEGIMAIVQNDNLGSVLPLGNAIQSLRPHIVVADGDARQAAEILGVHADIPQGDAVCAQCGSHDVSFRFYYKDKVVRSFFRFVMLPALFLGLPSGNIRRGYNCRVCGHWF